MDLYDLTINDISDLKIVENRNKENCSIVKEGSSNYYSGFVLYKKKMQIHCLVSFYRSSNTGKYIPRLIFKKTNEKGEEKTTDCQKPINIALNDSGVADTFWRVIGFLQKFKDLVDTGDFEKKYSLTNKDYMIEFEQKGERDKFEEIKSLIEKSGFKSINYLKELEFYERKKNLLAFLYLLRNQELEGKSSFDHYREKYGISKLGEEAVWQHFLLNNKWVLGLNADIRVINDLLSEQDVGMKSGDGKGSPIVDFMGISNYTTLIEVKTSNTNIFKEIKGQKSRANTWSFSNDFIEGFSQCLAQKDAFEKTYRNKDYYRDGVLLDKSKILTLDPKAIFLIGSRSNEFPHDRNENNMLKSKTFEAFKQNSKNVDIVTFDELFEKSYYTVFGKPPEEGWLNSEQFEDELKP